MKGKQRRHIKNVVKDVHLYTNVFIPSLSFWATISAACGKKIPEKVPPIIIISCGTTSNIRKLATESAPSTANILRIIGLDCVDVT